MTSEDSKSPRIPAPKSLDIGGRRMWKRFTAAYLLRVDELFVLESACKTLDTIAKLDEAMVGQPLVVRGSMGQEREHPLLREVRQQRAALTRFLAQLNIPEEDSSWAAGQRSAQMRKVANARWANRGGTPGPWEKQSG